MLPRSHLRRVRRTANLRLRAQSGRPRGRLGGTTFARLHRLGGAQVTEDAPAQGPSPHRLIHASARDRLRLTRPFREPTRTQTRQQPLSVGMVPRSHPLPVPPTPGEARPGDAYLARALMLLSRQCCLFHTFCNIVDGESKCYKSSPGHAPVPQPPSFFFLPFGQYSAPATRR